MELKACPNPRASASAAEFNVSPARRESSSKALSEPLEMLKYRWVFPLPRRPSALRSRRRLGGGGRPSFSIPSHGRSGKARLRIPHVPGKTQSPQSKPAPGLVLDIMLKTTYLPSRQKR